MIVITLFIRVIFPSLLPLRLLLLSSPFIPIVNSCGKFIEFSKLTGNTTASAPITISSPNYPANYNNYDHCVWVFESPKQQFVELIMPQGFQGETQNANTCRDFVQIRDGNATARILANLCYTNLTAITVNSSNRYLWVQFKSNDKIVAKGFQASVRSVRAQSRAFSNFSIACRLTKFKCHNHNCVEWSYVCDGWNDCGCDGTDCDEDPSRCTAAPLSTSFKYGVSVGVGAATFILMLIIVSCTDRNVALCTVDKTTSAGAVCCPVATASPICHRYSSASDCCQCCRRGSPSKTRQSQSVTRPASSSGNAGNPTHDRPIKLVMERGANNRPRISIYTTASISVRDLTHQQQPHSPAGAARLSKPSLSRHSSQVSSSQKYSISEAVPQHQQSQPPEEDQQVTAYIPYVPKFTKNQANGVAKKTPASSAIKSLSDGGAADNKQKTKKSIEFSALPKKSTISNNSSNDNASAAQNATSSSSGAAGPATVAAATATTKKRPSLAAGGHVVIVNQSPSLKNVVFPSQKGGIMKWKLQKAKKSKLSPEERKAILEKKKAGELPNYLKATESGRRKVTQEESSSLPPNTAHKH